MENRVNFPKGLFASTPQGEIAAPMEWWRRASKPDSRTLPTGCSNRAKCWSQTLETRRVRWARRFGLSRSKVLPSIGRLEASAENHMKSKEIMTGRAQPRLCSTNPMQQPGGVTVTVLRDNLCYNKRQPTMILRYQGHEKPNQGVASAAT